MRTRTITTIVLVLSLLVMPITALAKKGDKNFRRGMDYELAQQWDKAAQEFTLALAADPSNMEYQLHFRRASFNASQHYMQQGRTLAEEGDFVGAYNAFRQAYGYDPVNELAVSEMERMLRLQAVKEGRSTKTAEGDGNGTGTPSAPGSANKQEDFVTPHAEQLRVITYNGDLKAFIRSLAEQLNLNVIFDRTSFAQARPIDINLRDVTTAQALDYVFLQEGLFFQKLSRRTILVADQARRPQYQQLVLRTFFLSNMKPTDARTLVQQAIPPSVGRPQTIVVPDDATNSLTVRDTAENVRLIGDLLQSIDKDRAEVVMDVSIYEVSKNDMMQLGNQVGLPGSNGQPFTIGGSPGFSLLTDNAVLSAAQRGVSVQVLTNSLASTDEPAVHSGYAHYRRQLLEAGVQLHELRPQPGAAQSATAGGTSSGVSLHAKALVVDRQYVFVGSLNMDQRSKLLNTEMGLIVDSTRLAQAVREFFDTATQPENAFAVVLQGSPQEKRSQAKMTWLWSEDGHAMSDQKDPGVSRKRRMEVFIMRLLPIEGLL